MSDPPPPPFPTETPPPAPPEAGAQAGAPIRADLAHHAARKDRTGQVVAATAAIAGLLIVLFLGLWVWKLAFSDLPPIPASRRCGP